MNKINLFTSNRLEILARALCTVISKPLANPLQREIVVVQSQGMQRWLSMEIAKQTGVCANVLFSFPNAFAYDMFGKVIEDVPEVSPYERDTMVWKIFGILSDPQRTESFGELSAYIDGGHRELKTYQLSEKIAEVFDQYLLFRPSMILDWQNGKESHWQASLWRSLSYGNENRHRAALLQKFRTELGKQSDHELKLPERITVFGISALPEFHMRILESLSSHIQVNLFLLNPCRHFWGDLLSEKERRRQKARTDGLLFADEELQLCERDNSLLSSLGILGREFFDQINEYNLSEFPVFYEPDGATLLGLVQWEILNLEINKEGRRLIDKNDRSVQFHSCHSSMREIEVLYDNLLNLFEQDSTLTPADILVMTPDIETYVPYIQAVFNETQGGEPWIPYSIADRSVKSDSNIIETFMGIIGLHGGRFEAPSVLDILFSRPVSEKFGLSPADEDLISRWVSDTRIRWGADAGKRRELDLPEFEENSWKAGLDRILLGYSLLSGGENIYQGILPYDEIEGSQAEVLGKLLEFSDRLFDIVNDLGKPKNLEEWQSAFTEIIEKFFSQSDENERELIVIRRVIAELSELQSTDKAGFENEVGLDIIKSFISGKFDSEGFGFGFITGGITFCSMLPMRSIPFRVICIIGMNGDKFPRQNRPLGFDLIAKHPKPGDRSRRNDDRYLFLEIILSARDYLYISYIGQSIQDNSEIPPSVLVSELRDYLQEEFKSSSESITTFHPLQPFSYKYFTSIAETGTKLFSYSESMYNVAVTSGITDSTEPAFFSGELDELSGEKNSVDIDELCRFFNNPSKYLLQKRLGINYDNYEVSIEENEPFEISGLEKYAFQYDLLAGCLEGQDSVKMQNKARAKGLLPVGMVGECAYGLSYSGVESFAGKASGFIGNEKSYVDLNIIIKNTAITGRVHLTGENRLVNYRYAEVKAKDLLVVWIKHLALCCNCENELTAGSIFMGLSKSDWCGYEFGYVANSDCLLSSLVEMYFDGLKKPLTFFPETSMEFAKIILKGKNEDEAVISAEKVWEGSMFSRGDSKDPYYYKCFNNMNPFDESFKKFSLQVFSPMLGFLEEIED